MEIIEVFAMVGMMINDLMAILSLLGSAILLLGSFSKAPLKRYGRIADWSVLGLVFGIGFQASMAVTATMPEKIGFIAPMSSLMISTMLGISILMLVGRFVIRKLLFPDLPKPAHKQKKA
jgi:hypothetical protein